MPKLSAVSKSPLFEALCLSVATETASVTFACGGKIPMASNASGDGSQDQAAPRLQANPVTLRWDAQDGSISVKMTLPLTLATEGDVEQLIKDMQPATFGRGGEHVFDTSYRRASKLDPTKFTSSFNPYELGIIDTVAQALLPSLRGGKQVRGVRAELYSLNARSPHPHTHTHTHPFTHISIHTHTPSRLIRRPLSLTEIYLAGLLRPKRQIQVPR